MNHKLNNEESISEKTYWFNLMTRHKVLNTKEAIDLVKGLEKSGFEVTEDEKAILGKAFKVFTGKKLTF